MNNDEPTIPPATDQPDDQSPGAPADDQSGTIAPDHPLTDSNVDEHQAYDEGVAGAAGGEDPPT